MSDNEEREEFEKEHLIPDCVDWCANSGRYTHQYAGGEDALNDCIHYNAIWLGWRSRALRADAYKVKYLELIMHVGNKHPGETRHETAMKYIKRAEEPKITNAMGRAAPKEPT